MPRGKHLLLVQRDQRREVACGVGVLLAEECQRLLHRHRGTDFDAEEPEMAGEIIEERAAPGGG